MFEKKPASFWNDLNNKLNSRSPLGISLSFRVTESNNKICTLDMGVTETDRNRGDLIAAPSCWFNDGPVVPSHYKPTGYFGNSYHQQGNFSDQLTYLAKIIEAFIAASKPVTFISTLGSGFLPWLGVQASKMGVDLEPKLKSIRPLSSDDLDLLFFSEVIMQGKKVKQNDLIQFRQMIQGHAQLISMNMGDTAEKKFDHFYHKHKMRGADVEILDITRLILLNEIELIMFNSKN